MTRPALIPILILTLALAACGADGEPQRPAKPAPGLSITGEARMGVVTRQ